MAKSFTISKKDLLTHLQAVSKIISSKPIHPIMSCCLFEAGGEQLTISAADASGRIRARIACTCEPETSIKICIESKMLIEALKELPEQPITFTVGEMLNISIAYAGGMYNMVGKEPDAFPEPREVKDPVLMTLTGASLFEGFNKTLFCASDDELRPIMNSIYLEPGKAGINYVATDGQVLAQLSHMSEAIDCHPFPLPAKTSSILRSIIPLEEQVTINVGSHNVVFDFGEYQVTSVYSEGKYPNYRSVIPTQNDKKVIVETYAMKGALSRVGIFANQTSKLIILNLRKNQMTITAQDFDWATNAEETIVCDYAGPDFRIGFNYSLLTEIVSHIKSIECELSFSEPSKAALVRPTSNDEGEEITYLLMPLTINDY